MAATTLQAVIARFDGGTPGALTATSGKLWFDEVPPDKTFPFAAMAHGGTPEPDYNTEDDCVETETFLFHLQGTSVVSVEALALEVKKSFDLPGSAEAHAAFPIDNARCISSIRKRYQVYTDAETTPQGDKVYVAELDYELTVRKTKGLS